MPEIYNKIVAKIVLNYYLFSVYGLFTLHFSTCFVIFFSYLFTTDVFTDQSAAFFQFLNV